MLCTRPKCWSRRLETHWCLDFRWQPKVIECARVDGATDEGPTHLEVQFWWTLRHLKKPTFATLVSARCSGSSYLNRVELQNGCLALAHSNLFIPSNLNGSCFDPDSGKIDQQRLQANMDTATDIYIARCDGAPCGESVIHLVKGADSSDNQGLRSSVLIFLKGTKSQKEELKQEKPDDYELIEQVWEIRNRHMVKGLPSQYIFYVKCCQQEECRHPLCTCQHQSSTVWFPGGPSLSYLPFPIPDPSQPWGSTDCAKCEGACYGHFMDPEKAMNSELSPLAMPPSHILKVEFDKLGSVISEECIERVAKKCLLPPAEVQMWFEHLTQIQKNRKRGAEKAAETRRKRHADERQMKGKRQRGEKRNREEEETYCGVCNSMFVELTEEEEFWIQCDSCPSWFHYQCVGIGATSLPRNYSFVCKECSKA